MEQPPSVRDRLLKILNGAKINQTIAINVSLIRPDGKG
jgi:hypothetical protein